MFQLSIRLGRPASDSEFLYFFCTITWQKGESRKAVLAPIPYLYPSPPLLHTAARGALCAHVWLAIPACVSKLVCILPKQLPLAHCSGLELTFQKEWTRENAPGRSRKQAWDHRGRRFKDSGT